MRIALAAIAMALAFAACTSDNYDSGDGRYSYMTSDFVEAYAVEAGSVGRVVTDGGEELTLASVVSASWAEKVDTAYRALLYYNKVDGTKSVQPLSLSQLMVLRPVQTTRPDTLNTDPVTFESAWVSANGKYLNIGCAVKTGKSSDGELRKQWLGVKCDTIRTAEGATSYTFTLLHNQNGAPEYYSARTFVSIPLDDAARQATISLVVNGYEGEVNKSFNP